MIVERTERCVGENARIALDQDEYTKRYNGLVERYEKVKTKFESTTRAISDRESRKKQMEQFINDIKEQGPITKFDERLWASLTDHVTVYTEKDIRVTFKDGTEIKT